VLLLQDAQQLGLRAGTRVVAVRTYAAGPSFFGFSMERLLFS